MKQSILDRSIQDDKLKLQAAWLMDSGFFIGTTETRPMIEKQEIFLVLADCRPLAEVTSGHWISTADGRRTVADDPVAVSSFLNSLGLLTDLRSDAYGTTAVVAKNAGLIDEYVNSGVDASRVGRLFGYPNTAVAAFVNGDLLSADEQGHVEEQAGLGDISFFRFSRDNWRAELRRAESWVRVLRCYGFIDG